MLFTGDLSVTKLSLTPAKAEDTPAAIQSDP